MAPRERAQRDALCSCERVVPVEAFYFDAYTPTNKKSIVARTQSSAVYANVQADAFFTLTGCATPEEEPE